MFGLGAHLILLSEIRDFDLTGTDLIGTKNRVFKFVKYDHIIFYIFIVNLTQVLTTSVNNCIDKESFKFNYPTVIIGASCN